MNSRPTRRQIARELFDEWRNRCRPHDWNYGPTSAGKGGWGIVTCRRCGKWDLY